MRSLTAVLIVALVLPAVPGRAEAVPSFNESPGCGALAGVRGPLAPRPGGLPDSTVLHGPWADFYGRTVGDVRDQLIPVQLPGLPGQFQTVYIHERVLPAFDMVVDALTTAAADGNTYRLTSAMSSYRAETIPPHRRLSFHAVGAAIDVNFRHNPYRADNELITDMPDWYVAAWRAAGWCWGGDWLHLKDAMHFAWMGPLHTPGYAMPPPQPSLAEAADFTETHDLGVDMRRPPPIGTTHHVANIDRDGAPDIIRVQPRHPADGISVLAARSGLAHRYPRLIGYTDTPSIDLAAPRAFVDMSRDGMPDLVIYESRDGLLSLRVFTMVHGYRMTHDTVNTSTPYDGSAQIVFDDVNRDGGADVVVVGVEEFSVWLGPDFTEQVGPFALDGGADRFLIAFGDRDFDGPRDLYALDSAGRLAIHYGPDFERREVHTTPARLAPGDAFFVADLDGDGHPDLLIVEPHGATTMYRGGASTHHPGAWYELTRSDFTRADCEDDEFSPEAAPGHCRRPE